MGDVEPLGDRVRIRVEASPAIVAELTARATVDLELRAGVAVWAAVKATEIDVYPA